MQVSVVALIRNKPEHFAAFLEECQARVTAALGSAFRPYEVARQVHATLIGLERVVDPDGGYVNRNLYRHRDREAEMDFGGLLDYIRSREHFPMRIQIGGFADRDYPFTSRGRRPFFRSFTVAQTRASGGNTVNNVVVIGWPVEGLPSVDAVSSSAESAAEDRTYPLALDALRRGAERFHVLHAYHQEPTDVDNDFFFRIGRIDDPDRIPREEKQQLIHDVREWLSRHPPLFVEVNLSDVYVTQYASGELPPDDGTTESFPIDDPQVDEHFCRTLFEDSGPSH